jgi:predicted amidohydrolase YtcJ
MVTLFQDAILFPGREATDFIVADGKIGEIGAEAKIRPHNKTLSLSGCFVYPGFHDAHCHLLSVAGEEFVLDLRGALSFAELEQRAKYYLKNDPDKTAVIGKGMNETVWPKKTLPGASDLDRIANDRPVVFYRICGHIAVVNSIVLKRLPILKKASPCGIVTENDLDLLPEIFTPPSLEERIQALRRVLNRLSSFGLTAVSSNDLGRFANAADNAFYREARPVIESRLHLRTQYTPALDFRTEELDRLDETIVGKNPAIKVYVDGSLGGRTALLKAPYSDRPETSGMIALERDIHMKIAEAATARGLQMMTHAIGDEALSRTLDVYEKVTEAGNPLRHAVIHAQIADDDLLNRMAELGIIAIVQPSFTRSDRAMAKARLGSRYQKAYRFRTMAKKQIQLAFSSDAPIESIRPLQSIRDAIRAAEDPKEQFSFPEALKHHTQGAAFTDFLEQKKGQLQPGFDADFVVFREDLATIDPEVLPGLTPYLTVKGGEIVFQNKNKCKGIDDLS